MKEMDDINKKPKMDEPLTVESLDAAFRLAAVARDEFAQYRKMYPDSPTMLGIAVMLKKPFERAANEINQRIMLYRIQQKQELAIRTIHKWCKDPAIVTDTEAQTIRIAREHKAWSDLYRDGGNGAWPSTAVMQNTSGKKFMPPPDETIRQACREIKQYDEMLSRYESTIRNGKDATQC